MDAKLIGRMIQFHRKKSGLSQLGLAQLAGVGKTVVFDLEKGKITVRLDTLLKVLHVMNIRMEFIGPLLERFRESLNEKS